MKNFYLLMMLLINASGAMAADISTGDAAYLDQRFGARKDDLLLKDATASERASVHDAIVEPWTHDYPAIRDARVQSLLFNIYIRQCGEWARTHTNTPCPPAPKEEMQPGKIVADAQCNACHLFGTPETPAFFALSRSGSLTEGRLSAALAGGHRMSPITLSATQIHDLLIYIQGLK